MNEQQRPFVSNVTGYPVQYATQPIAPRGVQPTPYQYPRMQYPIGQSQLMMNTPTQPRPIHNAGPPAVASSPATVVRKRTIPETATMNTMNTQVKKKRAIDRNIPEKLDTLVPESRLYTELQEFERKLDSTIVRKKLEITESLSKPMKVKRTLRVFISNTSCNQQPVQEVEGNEIDYGSNIPAWTLKIEGRLLDPINAKNTRPPTRKFSHFFKSIIVELDRDPEMYPEGNLIEWNKTSDADDVDGFEIKRKGDSNLKAKIFLNLDQQPPRYKLSPELESILDIQEETKPGIIMALWQYIKHNNLQDNEDKRIINNDMRLYGIFNAPRIAFPQIPELISKHLAPVDPILIEYTIR
ncbi:20078_t:CDS:2, partial [Racocetra persica]